MSSKNPQPAPDQSARREPMMIRRLSDQPTTCTTCDAMQRRMLRMEEALRVIRILTDPEWSDVKQSKTMKHIHDRANDAILGR